MPRSIHIRSSRGPILAARLHGSLKQQKVVIICHGMLGTKSSPRHIELAKALSERGLSALRFDFAGRGNSEGSSAHLTPFGELQDLETVISYCQQKGAKAIALAGSSLGGAIVLMETSRNQQIAAVATWAAVTDFTGISMWTDPQTIATWQKQGYVLMNNESIPLEFLEQAQKINLLDEFAHIKAPLFISHGKQDEVVPYSQALQLHKLVPAAQLTTLEHADHRLSDTKARYQLNQKIAHWFSQTL